MPRWGREHVAKDLSNGLGRNRSEADAKHGFADTAWEIHADGHGGGTDDDDACSRVVQLGGCRRYRRYARVESAHTEVQCAVHTVANRQSVGYTGDSLDLKIVIAFLIGLALYNAVELVVLILVTFNKYRGLYFWSMVVSGVGIIPYSLGFLIKFFQCELRLFRTDDPT